MTNRTRRSALMAATLVPLGLPYAAAGASLPEAGRREPDEIRWLARAWFASLAAGQLHPANPSRHRSNAPWVSAQDWTAVPERFAGREAVAAIATTMGAANWVMEDSLVDSHRAAIRGTVRFPDGRAAAFIAFVTQHEGQVVMAERHVDRILWQPRVA